MGGQPSAAQRPMPLQGLDSVARAGRFVAAGADEEIGKAELVDANRSAQQKGHHAARKLAICRLRRKPTLQVMGSLGEALGVSRRG